MSEAKYTSDGLPVISYETLRMHGHHMLANSQEEADKQDLEWMETIAGENPVYAKFMNITATVYPPNLRTSILRDLSTAYLLFKKQMETNSFERQFNGK